MALRAWSTRAAETGARRERGKGNNKRRSLGRARTKKRNAKPEKKVQQMAQGETRGGRTAASGCSRLDRRMVWKAFKSTWGEGAGEGGGARAFGDQGGGGFAEERRPHTRLGRRDAPTADALGPPYTDGRGHATRTPSPPTGAVEPSAALDSCCTRTNRAPTNHTGRQRPAVLAARGEARAMRDHDAVPPHPLEATQGSRRLQGEIAWGSRKGSQPSARGQRSRGKEGRGATGRKVPPTSP
jgi:hypothetical protein